MCSLIWPNGQRGDAVGVGPAGSVWSLREKNGTEEPCGLGMGSRVCSASGPWAGLCDPEPPAAPPVWASVRETDYRDRPDPPPQLRHEGSPLLPWEGGHRGSPQHRGRNKATNLLTSLFERHS